jgi:hypothetical protein
MKIVIVCNGYKSAIKENGDFIDSCDRVIRMNNFLIEGWEQYVGKKIDIISMMITGEGATAGLLGSDRLIENYKKCNEVWIPDKYAKSHKKNRDRAREHFNRFKPIEFIFVDPYVYDALYKKMQDISESIGDNHEYYYPDSGMTIIESCLYRFKNCEIYVTGFDPMRKYPYKYYWEKYSDTSNCFNYHPQKAESILYNEYLQKGLIKELS